MAQHLVIPIRSPRSGLPLAQISAFNCIGPASNLALICPLHQKCESPITWKPSGALLYGWVSCSHSDRWINSIAQPDGRSFTVGERPADRHRSERPLELHELNHDVVVHVGEQYLLHQASQPEVKALMSANGIPASTPFTLPVLTIEESCGSNVAGLAKGDRAVELSSWLLYDRDETQGTLRHELAHILVARCGLREFDAHGEHFKRILKTIAPTTWEKDWWCNLTPAMIEARARIHQGFEQQVRQLCGVEL